MDALAPLGKLLLLVASLKKEAPSLTMELSSTGPGAFSREPMLSTGTCSQACIHSKNSYGSDTVSRRLVCSSSFNSKPMSSTLKLRRSLSKMQSNGFTCFNESAAFLYISSRVS